MSKEKSNTEYPVPVEPPELVAKRDRLLAALEKETKAASGTVQQVMRKMHDLLSNTKVSAPLNLGLYTDVKNVFARYMKEPVTAAPPAILMECVEFMQERLVAVGFTGQMEWPEGAPPMPPEFAKAAAEAAPAPVAPPPPAPPAARTTGVKDGFEGSGAPKRGLSLNPEATPPPSSEPKAEQQQLDSFKTWMKNPGFGKVRG
jgi:CBS domain-containing protein